MPEIGTLAAPAGITAPSPNLENMTEATEPSLLVVGEPPFEGLGELESIVRSCGYVSSTATWEQARALAVQPFCAILVDLPIAPSEAAELAKVASRSELRPPVLFLTQDHGLRSSVEAFTERGLEFVLKPATREVLLARLWWPAELLRLRQKLGEQSLLLRQKEELYEAELGARARAESAMRAREEVLAIVSHDLRNPMSTILASSGILSKRFGPEVERQTSMIERAVARMHKLVTDLLEQARIEAGQLTLDRRDHDAIAFAAQAAEAMRGIAEAKGVTLQFCSTEPACTVRCDQERMFQVLSNLVGNAISFTQQGGRIELKIERAGREAHFTVSDTGAGIAPEQLPHIFNRFWQATSTGRRGVGLGLSIAKGIIHAHCGRIWVESEVGVGTTFHFTIPLA